MKILKISFCSTVGGQKTDFQTDAEYYFLSSTKARIKFNVKLADFSTEYSLSKLNGEVVFTSNGDTNYSFRLQKNKQTKSQIKTSVGVLDCDIFAKTVTANFSENSLFVEISYSVNVHGNKSNSKILIRSI